MSRPVLHVRFLPGVIGETRRTVHTVPAPDGGTMPEVLVALCGEKINPGEAELVAPFAGMPCEPCGRAAITATLTGGTPSPPALPKEPDHELTQLLHELEAIAVQAITAHGGSPARARLAAHNLELLH